MGKNHTPALRERNLPGITYADLIRVGRFGLCGKIIEQNRTDGIRVITLGGIQPTPIIAQIITLMEDTHSDIYFVGTESLGTPKMDETLYQILRIKEGKLGHIPEFQELKPISQITQYIRTIVEMAKWRDKLDEKRRTAPKKKK